MTGSRALNASTKYLRTSDISGKHHIEIPGAKAFLFGWAPDHQPCDHLSLVTLAPGTG
jgi:hypothetical protein